MLKLRVSSHIVKVYWTAAVVGVVVVGGGGGGDDDDKPNVAAK